MIVLRQRCSIRDAWVAELMSLHKDNRRPGRLSGKICSCIDSCVHAPHEQCCCNTEQVVICKVPGGYHRLHPSCDILPIRLVRLWLNIYLKLKHGLKLCSQSFVQIVPVSAVNPLPVHEVIARWAADG